ncbi:Na/Pi symporter [Bacteroidota bacterium]
MLRQVIIALVITLLALPATAYQSPESNITTADQSNQANEPSLNSPANLILIKPVESGDNQYHKVNHPLDEPVNVQLVDENFKPVPGQMVHFSILSTPKKSSGFNISSEIAFSDSNGFATIDVTLGSKPGEYQVTARIESNIDRDFQVFTFHARKSNWVFMLIIGLLGGLGLFLLGMDMMSEGLKKSAGDKLRTILGNLTRNRFMALVLGTFVTTITQSSSATSVMLVGFVNSKLMKFKRTIGIILGANIGTTFTAQLIAFKLTDYSLLMIAIGFGLLYLASKQKYKYLGQSILGFGILFFGMHIMSEAMYPLRSFTPFIDLLMVLENPLLGILVGMIFTSLIQSSGAFIGITIVLAAQGLLTLEAAIPMLIGSNIGTAITAFLASIKASREAKKVAMANAFINIFGMLLFVWWIQGYADIVAQISPKSTLPAGDPMAMAETIPRQVANAHTLFNVVMAIIILPVTGQVARLIDWMLPEKPLPEEEMMKTIYLDESLVNTPALGLNLAKQEAMRIGTITQDMVGDVILPFIVKQHHVLDDLVNMEKQVDYLTEQVNAYLMRMIRLGVETERADEAFQIMYTVKELEEIADVIGNLMVQRAEVWIKTDSEFSDQGKKELVEYHTLTQKQLSRALEVFRDLNLEKAKRMKAKHKKYRSIASDLEKQHYERLRDAGKKIEETGDTHMELMTRLRTITHHSTNIARILLEWKTGKKE